MDINIKTKFNIGDRVRVKNYPRWEGTIDTIEITKFRECEIRIYYFFNVFKEDERNIELVNMNHIKIG